MAVGTVGKRAGARKAPRKRSFSPAALGYAAAITACIVAWGYLVWAAIDFGTTARAGDTKAWWFLGLATLGAVACLFVGLMLGARLLRAMGLVRDPVDPANPGGSGDSGRAAPGRRRATR